MDFNIVNDRHFFLNKSRSKNTKKKTTKKLIEIPVKNTEIQSVTIIGGNANINNSPTAATITKGSK